MSSDTQPSTSGPERPVTTLARIVGPEETFEASRVITGHKCPQMVFDPLEGGPMWFSDQKDSLNHVPSRVLSENLSSLKDERIVRWVIVSDQPGHVEYPQADRGAALPPAVSVLLRWDAECGRTEAR